MFFNHLCVNFILQTLQQILCKSNNWFLILLNNILIFCIIGILPYRIDAFSIFNVFVVNFEFILGPIENWLPAFCLLSKNIEKARVICFWIKCALTSLSWRITFILQNSKHDITKFNCKMYQLIFFYLLI